MSEKIPLSNSEPSRDNVPAPKEMPDDYFDPPKDFTDLMERLDTLRKQNGVIQSSKGAQTAEEAYELVAEAIREFASLIEHEEEPLDRQIVYRYLAGRGITRSGGLREALVGAIANEQELRLNRRKVPDDYFSGVEDDKEFYARISALEERGGVLSGSQGEFDAREMVNKAREVGTEVARSIKMDDEPVDRQALRRYLSNNGITGAAGLRDAMVSSLAVQQARSIEERGAWSRMREGPCPKDTSVMGLGYIKRFSI